MGKFRLPRRSFLRGAGGFAMALPALEIMQAKAGGDLAPQRYFVGFAGTSTGFPTFDTDLLVPDTVGAAYDTKRALQPITDLGINDHVSVVTNMEIPWGDAGSIPSAGRRRQWHATSTAPLISGVRGQDNSERPTAPSSDQVVAEAIAGDTLHPSISYRVQAAYYRGSNGDGGDRGRISYRMVDGSLQPVDPIISPRLAYESLFTGFIPPDPAEAAEALAAIRRRKSAVDIVAEDTQKLIPKLGTVDQQRLTRHFDELRALETRLDQIQPPTEGACEILPEPGEDPPIGGAVENGDTNGYASGGAYSDEETRVQVLTDLMYMAFVCDISRVGSVMYTMAQCFLNAFPLKGHASDIHELGHYGVGGGMDGLIAVSDGVAWHVQHWGRLLQMLRDTTDFDGRTVLDNTAAVLLFEGGHGFDPESGDDNSVHSSENMAVLIGGHAGGLNPNGGVHVPAPGQHPVNVVNTAMRAVGVDQDLGEVSGHINELLG